MGIGEHPFIYSTLNQTSSYIISNFDEMATIKLAKPSVEELKQLASIFDCILSKYNHFLASHRLKFTALALGTVCLGGMSGNATITAFFIGCSLIPLVVQSMYETNALRALTWKNRTLKILDLKLHPESFQ